MKTRQEALVRARAIMGTGGYRLGGTDLPKPDPGRPGKYLLGWLMDCIGAVLWAYDIPRHRPGFNRGAFATVSDDINTDSAIQDSRHAQEMFQEVAPEAIQMGDLVIYESDHAHGVRWGHVGLIASVTAVVRPGFRATRRVRVLQCHGPDGARMLVETGLDIFQLHTQRHPHNPSLYLRIKGT